MELTLREKAIEWWNNLDALTKKEYYLEYTKFTPAKSYADLTGREIQNIWAVKTYTEHPTESKGMYSKEDILAKLEKLCPNIKDPKYTNPFLYQNIIEWHKELSALKD